MSRESIDTRLRDRREENGDDCETVRKILEEGEKTDSGNNNSIHYNGDVLPNAVVKLFYGENPEHIRENLEYADPKFFPDAEIRMCDTSETDNPDVLVKEENAVAVVEDQSDRSILENNHYEDVKDRAVDFVDGMVSEFQLIDDFKLEEIHEYGDTLNYVDFEDREAIKDKPMHTDNCSTDKVMNRLAVMYGSLAYDLHKEYSVPLEQVKDDVADRSDVINSEEYRNNGFVPEMINSIIYDQ